VDWISGDFSPEDAVNSARLSARYLARQGKAWDLMAWGFTIQGERREGSNQKSAVQMQREAAVVLSQGGGFQSYYNQLRDGSVPGLYLPVIGEVARFCRARQAFCQGTAPVPQIALLYSTASHYREINGLFHRDLSRINGTLQALVESRQVVDVVGEHQLAGRMAEYPLIIVAECDYLEPDFKQQLIAYARNGGRLLLMGPQAAGLFEPELGVFLADGSPATRYLAGDGALLPVEARTLKPQRDARVRSLGKLHAANDAASAATEAVTIKSTEAGQIAATYFSFSREYLHERSPQMRTFLNDLVRQLFPAPMVEINGTPAVEVSVNRLGGKLAVNLVNTSGAHWDKKKPLIDSIEPIGPIELSIRVPSRPGKITLQPEGRTLSFNYRDGVALLTVPRLEIHCILVIE
jgi:hypothetical protein